MFSFAAISGTILVLLLITLIFRVIVITIIVHLMQGETTFTKTSIIEILSAIALVLSAQFGLIGDLFVYAITIITYIIGYQLNIKHAIIAIVLVYGITTAVPILAAYVGLTLIN